MRLYFEDLDKPVRLENCAPLLPLLESVLGDWSFYIDPRTTYRDGDELFSVARSPQGYVVHAPWLHECETYADEVDAVCGFIAELIYATTHQRANRLCLHGAAVEVEGRLIFFPCRQRAGKSTLIAALAALGEAHGIRVFADDVLTLDLTTGRAVANGIAPRIRLPLPQFSHPGVGPFIHDHILFNNQRYAYLATAPAHQTPRGATAEIAALILLQRDAQASTGLISCATAATLEQLIRQNFATAPPARAIFNTLQHIVVRSSRHVLHYADSSQAAELVLAMLEQLLPATAVTSIAAAALPERLRRAEAVYKTLIDGEAFLVNSRTNTIYKLDPLARAIWQLLEDSHTPAEITGIVREAFPEIDAQAIRRDVESLIQDMTRQGLIGASGDGNPEPTNLQAQRA